MRSSEFRVIDKQSIQPVTHHNYVALLLSFDLLGTMAAASNGYRPNYPRGKDASAE